MDPPLQNEPINSVIGENLFLNKLIPWKIEKLSLYSYATKYILSLCMVVKNAMYTIRWTRN